MQFLNNTITSHFIGISSRTDNSTGYKCKFSILYPKYTIVVNDKEFTFHEKAMNVAKIIGLKVPIPIFVCENELFVDESRQRIRLQDSKYYTLSRIRTLDELQSLAFSVTKRTALTDEDTLFAFRCIINDALASFEFATPGQMANEYGSTDVDEAIRVFNECATTRLKLRKSESELINLLNELSLKGIE